MFSQVQKKVLHFARIFFKISSMILNLFLFLIFLFRELNAKTSLRFVHTAFHGVGHDYVQLAFKAFGFAPPIPVQEQKDPDPDFSTVRCPNPEEGESVLVRILTFSCSFVQHKTSEIHFQNEILKGHVDM